MRGGGTGTTSLPAQPLLLSEMLQECQDSLCSQVYSGRVEQRHSTGWLERGDQLHIWREQLSLFLFPDNMWAEPVCWPCLQPGSSPCPAPAGSVLLPGRFSLTLAVSTAPLCTGISRHAAPGNAQSRAGAVPEDRVPKSTIPALLFLSADSVLSLEEMELCFTCILRSLEEQGLYLPCTPQMLWAMVALTAHLSQCCLLSEPP